MSAPDRPDQYRRGLITMVTAAATATKTGSCQFHPPLTCRLGRLPRSLRAKRAKMPRNMPAILPLHSADSRGGCRSSQAKTENYRDEDEPARA
jgi:hypothetical protein